MSTAEALPRFSFEEYLRLDQISDARHEWVAGQVFVMAGGTDRHLATVQAFFSRIAPLARAAGCRPWIADRRLRTSHASYYPDVFVVCGARGHRLYEADATWIVEVLSPSTASIDLREKASAYADLAGVEGYLVVDADLRATRVGRRRAGSDWSWSHVPADGIVALLGGEIDLAELWHEVDEVAPD